MASPNKCNKHPAIPHPTQGTDETEAPLPDLRILADSLRQLGDQLRQLTEEQRKTNKTITESIDALNTQLATLELQAGGLEPSAVSTEKAKSLLGCGRTKVFDLLKSGELQRSEKRHGSRTMVTVDSIERAQQQRQPKKRRASKHGHVRAGANLRKSIRTLPLTGEPDDSDVDGSRDPMRFDGQVEKSTGVVVGRTPPAQ